MIAIIDYDAGNLKNVANAFKKLGADPVITCNEQTILGSEAVVLPGVGAFADCMESLEKKGMDRVIRTCIDLGKPFLGICLGFQLLFEYSEEHPEGVAKGLGIFKGRVKKIPEAAGLKIPHMGWNNLYFPKYCPLFASLPGKLFTNLESDTSFTNIKQSEDSYVYFVHSYYAEAEDRSVVSAMSRYGICFDAAVSKDNVYATQFHPEKSGIVGMAILNNFLKVVRKV
ncbi:MAG TPA: imidazole glycerol phosphate synthase subunit HisH [Clostridiaceae bacterium]|jgi:glutamine amidotransferase|nr:imidazole glycerol phosphate synthase subunit HisH [Clostridiaceae bacterium]